MKIVAIIALAIACSSCGLKPQGASLDPSLALLIPSDTIAIVAVRLDQLQKTAVYQKYLSQQSIPQIDEFAKQTGIDPRRNLWEVAFITNGKKSAILGQACSPMRANRVWITLLNRARSDSGTRG